MASNSNIRNSKGRPINPARQVPGFVRTRDTMEGYDIPHGDRVKARNLDTRRARAEMEWRNSNAAGVSPAASPAAPAPFADRRQSLYAEMERAGSAGLTPEMRQRAKGLGVTDDQFNAAAGRMKTNEAFTPARAPSTAAPGTGWKTPPPVAQAAPAPRPLAPMAGSVNPETGRKMGAHPSDPSYWATGNPYGGSSTSPAATPPPESELVTQARNLSDGWKSAQQTTFNTLSKPAAQPAVATTAASPPLIAQSAPVVTPPAVSGRSPLPSSPLGRTLSGEPAWKRSVDPSVTTPAAPASAPSLGSAIAADAKSIGSGAKALGQGYMAGLNAAGRAGQATREAAVKAGSAATRAGTNVAAAAMTGAMSIGEKLIPGQTGDAIRDMKLPKKARKSLRDIGGPILRTAVNPLSLLSDR